MTNPLRAISSSRQETVREDTFEEYVNAPSEPPKSLRIVKITREDSQGRKTVTQLYMLADILPTG